MNAEIVRLIEKGMASSPVAASSSLASAPPLVASQGELFPLPDLDAFERKVGIVERTNRIFGVAAARRLWPMLGLPDLRTSDGQEDDGDGSRPSKAAGKPTVPRSALNGVRGAEGGHETPPPSAPRKLQLFRPWVARFIQECCEPEPKATLRAKAFREAYVRWAALHGAPLATPPLLYRYAVELGLRRHKSMGLTVYLDVRLKADEPAEGAV